jgi:bifunctional non-homologous end joining protein LigD
MPLSRKPAPFDHPEWVFELKYDGFRSLAVIQNGRCQLISRNGHPFNSFTELRKELTAFSHAVTLGSDINLGPPK